MKKIKVGGSGLYCSSKQYYISNKQPHIQFSEIVACCSAIASWIRLLSWPLTWELKMANPRLLELAGSPRSVCACLVPFQQFFQRLKSASLPLQVSVPGLPMNCRSNVFEPNFVWHWTDRSLPVFSDSTMPKYCTCKTLAEKLTVCHLAEKAQNINHTTEIYAVNAASPAQN